MLDHLTKVLLAAAIVGGFGAIIRFEVVAGDVRNFQKEVEKHYTKKEQFIEVKADIKYMKEKQERLDKKVDQILQAVRGR